MPRTPATALPVLLSLALAVSLALGPSHKRAERPERPRTLLERAGPCGTIVVGQMVACANGRAYVRGRGRWRDAGPWRPEPIVVPALVER